MSAVAWVPNGVRLRRSVVAMAPAPIAAVDPTDRKDGSVADDRFEVKPTVLTDEDRRAILEQLHRAEYRSLVRLAVLLVDTREAAEEIVQDAFVRMFHALDGVADPSARPAYLRSIVMNQARSRLRHRKVTEKHPPGVDRPGAGADEGARLREDQREVIEALRQLPGRQRECLVLRYYGECGEAEIATTLGISRGAVKSHLSRAMRAMEKTLEAKQ